MLPVFPWSKKESACGLFARKRCRYAANFFSASCA